MGGLTTFSKNEVLDQLFGALAYVAPATLYFGLSTTTITEAGGNITEPASNYARKSITNDKTLFSVAATGALDNDALITFITATGAWGTVIDFFIADAVTAGNILAYGTLTVAKTITSGDTAQVSINNLDISIT